MWGGFLQISKYPIVALKASLTPISLDEFFCVLFDDTLQKCESSYDNWFRVNELRYPRSILVILFREAFEDMLALFITLTVL